MRQIAIEGGFGLENLRVQEASTRAVGPEDVRLSMRAASLNYRDLMMVRGQYNPRQPLPLVPLSDGVGVVVERGAEVRSVEVGARVCPIFAQGWLSGEPTREKLATARGGPYPGVLAEEVVIPASSVVSVPAHLTDQEAATLPCAALTAWSALVGEGRLAAGDTVLVEGTGGVSLFALAIAKLHGARVIVTSSSDDKLARARALGADQTINYRTTPAWGREAKKLTQDRGVDHIVEVGGSATVGEALKAVRPGGTISIIGALSGGETSLSLISVLMQQVRLQGIFTGHRESFVKMNRAIEQGGLKPVIDRVFPFEATREALEHMAKAEHFGKIVIQIA